jgi:hypothetical protein
VNGWFGGEMRVYYAHAMCIYGHPVERAERRQIKRRFPKCKIIDPGEYEGNLEKKVRGMQYCFELISNCDLLVFSRLYKQITSGVGLEISYALSKGIRVYELCGKRLKEIKRPRSCLSRQSTVQLYRIWRINEWRRQKAAHLVMSPAEIHREIDEIKKLKRK